MLLGMSPAESAAVSAAIYPFFLLAVLTALAAIRYAVIKWFPDCWLKRVLLKDV